MLVTLSRAQEAELPTPFGVDFQELYQNTRQRSEPQQYFHSGTRNYRSLGKTNSQLNTRSCHLPVLVRCRVGRGDCGACGEERAGVGVSGRMDGDLGIVLRCRCRWRWMDWR